MQITLRSVKQCCNFALIQLSFVKCNIIHASQTAKSGLYLSSNSDNTNNQKMPDFLVQFFSIQRRLSLTGICEYFTSIPAYKYMSPQNSLKESHLEQRTDLMNLATRLLQAQVRINGILRIHTAIVKACSAIKQCQNHPWQTNTKRDRLQE